MKLTLIMVLALLFSSTHNFAYGFDSKEQQTQPAQMDKMAHELAVYLEKIAEDEQFSGTVLLAHKDKVLFKSAYGLASKRFNVPNNLETKFNLASMNKMFTSVAILQLVEKGQLTLTDKLSRYVDDSWINKSISQKIEIQHLLSHRSGLGNYFNKTFMDGAKTKFRVLEDFKVLVDRNELLFEPGSKAGYSNTGMLMLGLVIEAITSKDYFVHIDEAIYQNSGMAHSASYEMDQPIPNLAIGYDPTDKNSTGWVNNTFVNVIKGGPAGGGYSTVDDMHKFALAIINNELIGESITAKALSVYSDFGYGKYGLGFYIRGEGESKLIGHGGGFVGIGTNLDISLSKGYIAIVLSNYGRGDRQVRNKIRELIEKH